VERVALLQIHRGVLGLVGVHVVVEFKLVLKHVQDPLLAEGRILVLVASVLAVHRFQLKPKPAVVWPMVKCVVQQTDVVIMTVQIAVRPQLQIALSVAVVAKVRAVGLSIALQVVDTVSSLIVRCA
jgi:hypothetical protein